MLQARLSPSKLISYKPPQESWVQGTWSEQEIWDLEFYWVLPADLEGGCCWVRGAAG